jgi:5-methylcytosine-specific restriction endonuclease McrA
MKRIKMTKEKYVEYLKSPHWGELRKRYYASKLYKTYYQGCNKFCCYSCHKSDIPLDLHHRTYKRLGNEHLNDLVLLCRECHGNTHSLEKGLKTNVWSATKKYKKCIQKNSKKFNKNIDSRITITSLVEIIKDNGFYITFKSTGKLVSPKKYKYRHQALKAACTKFKKIILASED